MVTQTLCIAGCTIKLRHAPQQLIRIDCTGGGGDEFTVDSIKTYEVSQVKDVSKHDPGMQHDAAAAIACEAFGL